MTRKLFKASLLLLALSVQARASDDRCGRGESAVQLENYYAPAVRIGLPSGTKGPQTEADTGDYRWNTPIGVIRVMFWKDVSSWNARQVGTEKVGPESISLYKWRDYSGHEQLVAEWSPGSTINRPTLITIPVDWSSCASIATAKLIVASVRFINNPQRLRAEAPTFRAGKWTITIINELGEKRTVSEGDVVTWDNGVVDAIDAHGLLVRTYDWRKGKWSATRIDVAQR
ncbi:MAG: hypothetical protein ACYC9L_06195 [Sulfuricaulis sp.]